MQAVLSVPNFDEFDKLLGEEVEEEGGEGGGGDVGGGEAEDVLDLYARIELN